MSRIKLKKPFGNNLLLFSFFTTRGKQMPVNNPKMVQTENAACLIQEVV